MRSRPRCSRSRCAGSALYKAPGFIMLAVGLIIDMMIPQAREWQSWAHVGRATALLLVSFGLIRLTVETFLILRYRRKADPSTIVAEIVLTSSYGNCRTGGLAIHDRDRSASVAGSAGSRNVGRRMDAAGQFFRRMLLQSHRPFVSGDWVRLGDHSGRVVGTGWRATWIVTRNNEHVFQRGAGQRAGRSIMLAGGS